jgi:putative membrane protein
MKASTISTLVAAALAVSACGHKEANTTEATSNTAAADLSNTSAVAPTPSGGQAFANAAASSDAFEIATSKLALANASSGAVKAYAKKMIDVHTDSTAKLKAAASSATPSITPVATLDADQQAKLDALKADTGTAFDHAYAAAQVEGHQKTLDTLRAYASDGDVSQLKSFATTLVPIVTAHLNMAKGLAK